MKHLKHGVNTFEEIQKLTSYPTCAKVELDNFLRAAWEDYLTHVKVNILDIQNFNLFITFY